MYTRARRGGGDTLCAAGIVPFNVPLPFCLITSACVFVCVFSLSLSHTQSVLWRQQAGVGGGGRNRDTRRLINWRRVSNHAAAPALVLK
jgi:hypothetical protein